MLTDLNRSLREVKSFGAVRKITAASSHDGKTIEGWLKDIARNHYKIEGSAQTCCNNHYYRRALYMSIICVVTGNDENGRSKVVWDGPSPGVHETQLPGVGGGTDEFLLTIRW